MRHRAAIILLVALTTTAPSAAKRVEVLTSVSALPPHVLSVFHTPVKFEQIASGQYFVFDLRNQTVFGIDKDATASWRLVGVGSEVGRVIEPNAFDAEPNGTFLVADSPGDQTRLQIFGVGGNRIGGFTIPGRPSGRFKIGTVTMTGLAMTYTGRTVLVNQPETGSLITEYTINGLAQRSIGRVRATGHEQDPGIHLALNRGIPLSNPLGGYYVVFMAGMPLLQKYDAGGTLVFERHIEGSEVDALLKVAPTTWMRTRENGDVPLVVPNIVAAAVDGSGSLWIALSSGFTYVYDADGEKTRVVQFKGAGLITPTSLTFAPNGRLLVTPGCYEFDPRTASR
jgi:hypothetical protein